MYLKYGCLTQQGGIYLANGVKQTYFDGQLPTKICYLHKTTNNCYDKLHPNKKGFNVPLFNKGFFYMCYWKKYVVCAINGSHIRQVKNYAFIRNPRKKGVQLRTNFPFICTCGFSNPSDRTLTTSATTYLIHILHRWG